MSSRLELIHHRRHVRALHNDKLALNCLSLRQLLGQLQHAPAVRVQQGLGHTRRIILQLLQQYS